MPDTSAAAERKATMPLAGEKLPANSLGETQEHLFDCADHAATHECFRERHRALQQGLDTWIDTGALRPWESLGWLQGRVDPG